MFNFSREPAVIVKVAEEIVRAAIPLALVFDWVTWTEAQAGAVMLFVGVLAGAITAVVIRTQVVPNTTANNQIEVAIQASPTATVQEVIAEEEKQRIAA